MHKAMQMRGGRQSTSTFYLAHVRKAARQTKQKGASRGKAIPAESIPVTFACKPKGLVAATIGDGFSAGVCLVWANWIGLALHVGSRIHAI